MYYRIIADYELEIIEDKYYLLCYGTSHINFGEDLTINETGAIIWNQLTRDDYVSLDKLIKVCEDYYETNESQHDAVKASTISFMQSLVQKNIVEETTNPSSNSVCKTNDISIDNHIKKYQHQSMKYPIRKYKIADIVLEIRCLSQDIDSKLEDFRVENCMNTDQIVTFIQTDESPINESSNNDANVQLIDTDFFTLNECKDYYIYSVPNLFPIKNTIISKDGRNAYVLTLEHRKDVMFESLRFAFLYYALLRGNIAIHSSSMIYQEKAWLFTGPSGRGKSTHIALWKKLYDVMIINGDINLVSFCDHTPMVHGLPWCGTSGQYRLGKWELGGIVFLERSDSDYSKEIDGNLRVIRTLHRVVSPLWISEQLQKTVDIITSVISSIHLFELHCTINDTAVEACKKAIGD